MRSSPHRRFDPSQRPTWAPTPGQQRPRLTPPASAPRESGPAPRRDQHGSKGPKGPPLKPIAAVVVVLAVLYGAVTVLGGSGGAPVKQGTSAQSAERLNAAQANAPAKPASWSRQIDSTFYYARQQVTVRTVKVSGLDGKTARVSYQLTVVPKGTSRWVRQKSTYQLLSPDRRASPRRVKVTRTGGLHRVTVTFRWPSKSLVRPGAGLRLNIPTVADVDAAEAGSVIAVRIALEVPESHEGVEVRSSDGGL